MFDEIFVDFLADGALFSFAVLKPALIASVAEASPLPIHAGASLIFVRLNNDDLLPFLGIFVFILSIFSIAHLFVAQL